MTVFAWEAQLSPDYWNMGTDHVNFYFLSSGFCGTRFHHHVLRRATNAEVWHQPGHEEISEITDLLEKRFAEDHDSFLRTSISEFPYLKRRIDKRLALPWIYGDTLNWMRALGYMLYRYMGPKRLRLVGLIRHPTATCRSMLAYSRGSAQTQGSDIRLAEEMARRWVGQYSHIRYQFAAIDDPQICKTIRLEDTNLAQLRELYDFLGLEGFDEATISGLLGNRSVDIRHSHLEDSPSPASKEELRAIWRVCAPLAEQFGYTEQEGLYDTAPSRPTQYATSTMNGEAAEARSASVKLFGYRGLGLILRGTSGTTYINQAGGPLCMWLHAEGTFIPLAEGGEGSIAHKLFDHFHHGRSKEFMNRIQQPDADYIDGLLAEQGLGFISVNRARIGEAWDLFSWQSWEDPSSAPWEAWVPVRVRRTRYNRLSGTLSGIDVPDAVLIWENSN